MFTGIHCYTKSNLCINVTFLHFSLMQRFFVEEVTLCVLWFIKKTLILQCWYKKATAVIMFIYFRQKKNCCSPRDKQRQQKTVLCYKATWNADKKGEGEFFFLLYLLFMCLLWRGSHSNFYLHLVWRTFSTKPKVLWNDPRIQRDLGNHPYISYWPGEFGLVILSSILCCECVSL